MISFAVTPDQSILLAMAAEGGARLRIGLPPQDETKKVAVIDGYKHLIPTTDDIRRIFADDWKDEAEEGPKVELVKARVPKEVVPFGTRLTQEVLDKQFKEVGFPKDLLPETAVATDKELLDQYAAVDLVPNLLVPKPHLAAEKPKKPDPMIIRHVEPGAPVAVAGAKAEHADDAASPKSELDTTPSVPKKEYVYVTIKTPQGQKVHQYEVTPKGNVFVKELAEGEQPPDLK